MTKLSNNKAKIGKGQKVKLGSNNAYEVYQNPATGQLEIIDTRNNSRALVDKEDRGRIGGNGTFIKALKNGEPMADTGKTYSTVQGAVDAASSWVFVPPGTYNESLTVNTHDLVIRGGGRGSYIDGGTAGHAIQIDAANVDIRNLSVETSAGSGNDYHGIATSSNADRVTLEQVRIRDADFRGVNIFDGGQHHVINCIVESSDEHAILNNGDGNTVISGCITQSNVGLRGLYPLGDGSIVVNNIVNDPGGVGIRVQMDDGIVGGNRVHSSGAVGIDDSNKNNIIFNNRVSDSSNADIRGRDSNTLDGNLTGSAN